MFSIVRNFIITSCFSNINVVVGKLTRNDQSFYRNNYLLFIDTQKIKFELKLINHNEINILTLLCLEVFVSRRGRVVKAMD